MAEATTQTSPAATQQPMSPPASLHLNLAEEIGRLHADPSWQTGISRKSLVRYPDFQINLIAMRAGSRIDEHHNPGRISVQTVKGHIRLHALGRLFDLPEGQMLVLDRAIRHDVEAVEESAFLLTVARPESEQSR